MCRCPESLSCRGGTLKPALAQGVSPSRTIHFTSLPACQPLTRSDTHTTHARTRVHTHTHTHGRARTPPPLSLSLSLIPTHSLSQKSEHLFKKNSSWRLGPSPGVHPRPDLSRTRRRRSTARHALSRNVTYDVNSTTFSCKQLPTD